MKKSYLAAVFVVVLSFAVTAYFYPNLPENMATHWNTKGEVDSYMPRFWGSMLVPLMSLGMLGLFAVLPKIDPLKANYKFFGKYYQLVVMSVLVFLLYVHAITLMFNSGYEINMTYSVVAPLSIIFILVGYAMTKTKRNWFMGIRNPWTLNSDTVWRKTHDLGGKLFAVYGIILIFAVIFGFIEDYLLYIIVIPVFVIVAITFIYSYFIYKKEVTNND